MSTSRFLAGALCGVAVGLLLAPEKGSELREDIVDTAEKLRWRFNRIVGKADAKLDDLRDLLEKNIDGLSEDVRHRILTILDDASEMAYSSNNTLNKDLV